MLKIQEKGNISVVTYGGSVLLTVYVEWSL